MKITLKTLPQATAQQVFDQVAQHLLAQQEKSEHHGQCQYRAGGLSCAAGCLIGDDEYSEEFEGAVWGSLVDRGVVPDTHENLINSLQAVHDSNPPYLWEDGLLRVAGHYNLSAGVLP